jgi:hypothetical protein
MSTSELFDDFIAEHLQDLKKEFMSGRAVDWDCLDYETEVAFDKYCVEQFNEWRAELPYLYC